MSGNQFWSATTVDPKRSFRWVLFAGPENLPTYIVKTAAKPGFTVSNVPHSYLSHKFNFPGRLTWDNLQITLVDPIFPDASATMIKILQASGYAIPGVESDAQISFSKADAVDALGVPAIAQLDGSGRIIETWTLRNCWVETVKFGNLDYNTEDMVNITITLRYDWAEYAGNDGSMTPNGGEAKPILSAGHDQRSQIETYQKQLGKVKGASI